jgi:acyl-coenzyme A synthetase/AMP-(fatty) acid ligase
MNIGSLLPHHARYRPNHAAVVHEDCAWIKDRVDAKNQRVRAVVIMEDFPRSTAGKTLKRILREPYWADHHTKSEGVAVGACLGNVAKHPAVWRG